MSLPLTRSTKLCLVLDTPKVAMNRFIYVLGRGVFASCPISRGTVIDTAPVIVLSPDEWENHVQHTMLAHYTYNWPRKEAGSEKVLIHQAVVLGLGSMFNHSRLRQNVGWKKDIDAGAVIYTTLRDIKEGEELLISYGDKLWFDDVEANPEPEDSPEGVLGALDLD